MAISLRMSARVALLLSLATITACAQEGPPATEVGASQLAMVTLRAKSTTKLSVSTPAFLSGGDIPLENTQYKGNVFPGLTWSPGPPGTQSYAVIMQDADALREGAPILHWTMLDIPAAVTKLDPAMTTPPPGSQYGPNIQGTNQPYWGPRTPPGPKHRYHFQIFALDTTLPAESASTYAALTGAMNGHVLASGEVIGLGRVGK